MRRWAVRRSQAAETDSQQLMGVEERNIDGLALPDASHKERRAAEMSGGRMGMGGIPGRRQYCNIGCCHDAARRPKTRCTVIGRVPVPVPGARLCLAGWASGGLGSQK